MKVVHNGLNEKNQTIVKNVLGSFLIKGLSLFISIFSMPLYIKYFENQIVLGLWFTIVSVLSWILTFDLGLGNGLRNRLVETIIQNNNEESSKLISSSYAIVGILSIIIIFFALFGFSKIDWNIIFNIDKAIISNETLLTAIKILFIGIMISFILKLINSILYALQKSAVNNALALITSILPLIYIVVAPNKSMEENLISLAWVNAFSVCLPLLFATIVVFSFSPLKECKPSLKNVHIKTEMSVLSLGSVFFIVQVAFMFINSTNEIIITNFWSPEFVVEYQIYNKVFSLVGSIFSIALTPVWSSVTKALVERDFLWLKNLSKTLYRIAVLGIIFEFSLILFLQKIIDIWLGDSSINVNYMYAMVFAVYGSLFIYNIIVTTIANGVGYLKTQLICYSLGAVFKIPILLIINHFFSIDWVSVVGINVFIFFIFDFIQTIWLNKFIKNKIV